MPAESASTYWKRIGGLARLVLLNTITMQPHRFNRYNWKDIPKPIRSRLSDQMNRLQGRRNRKMVTLSSQQRKDWGIRKRVKWPSHDITPGQWDRIYALNVSAANAQDIFKKIYEKGGLGKKYKVNIPRRLGRNTNYPNKEYKRRKKLGRFEWYRDGATYRKETKQIERDLKKEREARRKKRADAAEAKEF